MDGREVGKRRTPHLMATLRMSMVLRPVTAERFLGVAREGTEISFGLALRSLSSSSFRLRVAARRLRTIFDFSISDAVA